MADVITEIAARVRDIAFNLEIPPLALAEGLKYQQLEVLKKRQKDDAESLDKLLAEQQAGPE